ELWQDRTNNEICYEPFNTLEETSPDPQVRHRGMVVAEGASLMPGPPIKLSDTPASIRTPPARFGEHTEEVLGGLGFGTAEIARLRREGVVLLAIVGLIVSGL